MNGESPKINETTKENRFLDPPKENNQKREHPYVIFVYGKEKNSVISTEQEQRAKGAFIKVVLDLEKEWQIDTPIKIRYILFDNTSFGNVKINGSKPKKYNFIARDHKNNFIYLNSEIFSTLPNDADAIIKHETAHVVVEHLVGDLGKYRKSYFLEEGTAGLDGATAKLVAKLKKEGIKEVPNPLLIQSIKDSKEIGGDTDKEPFIDQLGYLVLFSSVEFLRKRIREKKILEVYRKLGAEAALEDAYRQICGASLSDAISEWSESIKSQV